METRRITQQARERGDPWSIASHFSQPFAQGRKSKRRLYPPHLRERLRSQDRQRSAPSSKAAQSLACCLMEIGFCGETGGRATFVTMMYRGRPDQKARPACRGPLNTVHPSSWAAGSWAARWGVGALKHKWAVIPDFDPPRNERSMHNQPT